MHFMADNFLLKEYEECFIQLRHYDDRLLSLLKFAITISSSMAGGFLAIYEIISEKSMFFWMILSLVSGCVFIGIFIITLGMIQIRLYYVHTARQLNAIRDYQLNHISEFKGKNQMYLTVNIPAFKWRSVQLLMILGVSLLAFAYLAIATSSFLFYSENSIGYSLSIGLIFSFVMWGCNVACIRNYLFSMDRKPSDEAVHGR